MLEALLNINVGTGRQGMKIATDTENKKSIPRCCFLKSMPGMNLFLLVTKSIFGLKQKNGLLTRFTLAATRERGAPVALLPNWA